MRRRSRLVAALVGGLLVIGCTTAVAASTSTPVECDITDNTLTCPLPEPPPPVTETQTVTQTPDPVTVTETATTTVSVPAGPETLFGDTVPANPADADAQEVELGVKFKPALDGVVTGIRFYKGAGNTGAHTGSLWSGTVRVATVNFTGETDTGWQTAKFATPVIAKAGTEYVASYLAPVGHYAGDGGYAWPKVSGSLTASGSVYKYGGGRPTDTFGGTNYYVDVLFIATGNPPATTTAPTTPATTAPTTTTQPSTSTPTTPTDPGIPILDLPRIPWEGAGYWSKFPNADAAGWDDPSFFPIGCWFCNVSGANEIAFDKSKGINTYLGMWEGTDFNLFPESNVYWLGTGLKNQDNNSPYNPGVFLDDEADGTYTPPSAGQQHLADVKATVGPNRFAYANFTQLVVGSDMGLADQQKFVNDYTDAVSVDMYWYSIPFCDQTPYRGGMYAVPVPQATCRTAHSYGLTNEALRLRDASDGKLQPTWTWVENFNGLSGQSPRPYTSPAQIKGAAMSTIIHEARGLFWFNQSFTGDCQTSNVIRQAQVDPNSTCGRQYRANIDAMGDVNNFVKSLAPVLNTQSYQWNFGAGIDSMLKVKDGSAYVFAMTDGTSGNRTFTLPSGVTGTTVEVVGEGRSIPVNGGSFSDGFAAESAYHVYKVAL